MTKEYYNLNEKNNLGNGSICTQVFESIAYGAMQKVEGAWINLPSGFPKTGKHPVTSQLSKDDSISLTVDVVLKYGLNISKVTESIQKQIMEAIKQMTNIDKCKVDVVIKSIEFEN